jgi:hypothetical protein
LTEVIDLRFFSEVNYGTLFLRAQLLCVMKKEISNSREWDRLANVSARTGISRPELFRHVVCGDILGSHIKKPSASKGVWLVNLASVDEFIRSFLPGGSRYQKGEPQPIKAPGPKKPEKVGAK